ncbi:hypothetical protein BGZ81_008461 [Podila clonocystis]|nr:hypothetical protein BGZ81_008461 [Podila clonocystis]
MSSTIDNRLSVGLTQHTHQGNTSQRMIQTRPRSQANYSNYFPPPLPLSTSAPSDISRISGPSRPPSGSSFSTSSNSPPEPSSDHNLSADARFQNWRQPAHRSKLSKQYTPSETEDSDEESEIKRRSRFLSGAALELNSDAAENLRAMSRLSVSSSRPATPSESADSESVKSTKKISFGKRISKLFGGNKKSLPTPSSSSSSSSSSTSTSPTSSNIKQARSSTISLGPIMEQPGLDRDALEAPRANSLYIHARSHSTPDQIGQSSLAQYAKMEESKLRKARDSGFEDSRGRRYSGSTVPTISSPGGASPRHSPRNSPLLGPRHIQPSAGNRSSILRPEPMYIEQQTRHDGRRQSLMNAPSSPQLRGYMDPSHHHSRDGQHSPMLRPTTPMEVPRARRTTVTDYPMSHHSPHNRNSFIGSEAMPRRSSTPTQVSETLISKVDREKASVCFQAPSVKRDSFTRDANLDPALSNLVQQHRKDFKTNQRLGGTPTPVHPSQNYHPHHQHHQHNQFQRQSPRLSAVYSEESPMIRDPSARRDSSGSQHHYHPHGLAPELTPAQMKRLSTGSQHQHYMPPVRASPKRQSSAGYFTPHMQPHNMEQPPLLHISPFPSPSLGAVATSPGYIPDLSLAVQQQQLDQLQQIRIQQQHVLLQQQQHLQHQLQQSRAAAAAVGIAPVPVMTPIGMGIMVNNGSGTLTPLLVNPSASSPLYTYPVPGYQ